VKVSELATRAGIRLSAVKFYQREGLLPDGVKTAPNQVAYDETHVKRVRLIRALLETGGLSIAATKEVITAVDAEGMSMADTFGVAQQAMSTPRTTPSVPSAESRDVVMRLAQSQGWMFLPDNPGIDAAARALDGLRAIDFTLTDDYLSAYATAASTAATADLHALAALTDPDELTELMVVGTILGDPFFAGLRRIAHENSTHHLFPTTSKRDAS
jgi:DNA-binding transcriptional MerR regulator